jgi:hypothetical protein
MDGNEAMGFDVTQVTQDVEQSVFTIKTNMPIPVLVYGDAFQWAKYGIRSSTVSDNTLILCQIV